LHLNPICAQLLSRAVDVQDRARRLYAQLQPAARADEGHPVRTAPLHLRRGSPSSALDHSGSRMAGARPSAWRRSALLQSRRSRQGIVAASACLGYSRGAPDLLKGLAGVPQGYSMGFMLKCYTLGVEAGTQDAQRRVKATTRELRCRLAYPAGPRFNRNRILGHPQPSAVLKAVRALPALPGYSRGTGPVYDAGAAPRHVRHEVQRGRPELPLDVRVC